MFLGGAVLDVLSRVLGKAEAVEMTGALNTAFLVSVGRLPLSLCMLAERCGNTHVLWIGFSGTGVTYSYC